MKSVIVLAALFFTVSAGFTQSKDSLIAPWFVEKFKLSIGFFNPINNTKIQVGVNGAAEGTHIDFEKDLGMNASIATFLANFQWRISRRSRVSLGYFDMRRSATKTLDREIVFKDQTYPVKASVNSQFNTAIYQISYGYAIIEKPKFELGLLIGTHTVYAKTSLSVNGATAGASAGSNYGFSVPLPDLGIWGGYAFSDRLAVNLDFDYLALTIDNIDGRILAYNFLVSYKLLRQLNVSLGYTGLNFQVSTTKQNVNGEFRWGYNGPTAGATFVFGKRSWKH